MDATRKAIRSILQEAKVDPAVLTAVATRVNDQCTGRKEGQCPVEAGKVADELHKVYPQAKVVMGVIRVDGYFEGDRWGDDPVFPDNPDEGDWFEHQFVLVDDWIVDTTAEQFNGILRPEKQFPPVVVTQRDTELGKRYEVPEDWPDFPVMNESILREDKPKLPTGWIVGSTEGLVEEYQNEVAEGLLEVGDFIRTPSHPGTAIEYFGLYYLQAEHDEHEAVAVALDHDWIRVWGPGFSSAPVMFHLSRLEDSDKRLISNYLKRNGYVEGPAVLEIEYPRKLYVEVEAADLADNGIPASTVLQRARPVRN